MLGIIGSENKEASKSLFAAISQKAEATAVKYLWWVKQRIVHRMIYF